MTMADYIFVMGDAAAQIGTEASEEPKKRGKGKTEEGMRGQRRKEREEGVISKGKIIRRAMNFTQVLTCVHSPVWSSEGKGEEVG